MPLVVFFSGDCCFFLAIFESDYKLRFDAFASLGDLSPCTVSPFALKCGGA